MENKCNVIKSKSSNSAVTTKSENRSNKMSRSNAELQKNALKKRGMYVEKKITKISIHKQGNDIEEQNIVKPPPRPRPGNKRFLNSVLTILSKSTTGTQHPENVTTNAKRREINKINSRNINLIEKEADYDKTVKIKPKYNSRVLNGLNKSINEEQLVILQPRKDIVQTPSNYSETESFKLSDLSSFTKNDKVIDKEKTNQLRNNVFGNDGMAKHVFEYKTVKRDKKVRIEDPVTLVESAKDDKGLYNFFVDLLETTISVYNMKADYNAVPASSEVSSKVALDIDESVAEKLNFKADNTPETSDDVTKKPSKHYYCTVEKDNEKLFDYFQNGPDCKITQREMPLKMPWMPCKRRLKAQSLIYYKKPQQLKTESAVLGQKSLYSRKNRKRTLLKMFKEQLKLDADALEESQNFYQALRVMARNKRQCQKSIRFDKSVRKRKSTDFNNQECIFKRRKVISPSTKSSIKKNSNDFSTSINSRHSEFTNNSRSRNIRSEYSANLLESNHSLEVHGFDYEVAVKKRSAQRQKDIQFPYHSSGTLSEDEVEPNYSILKYIDSNSFKTKSCDLYSVSQVLRQS